MRGIGADRRGGSLVEYLLLVGLVAIVVLFGLRGLGARGQDKTIAQAACVDALACAPDAEPRATAPGTDGAGEPGGDGAPADRQPKGIPRSSEKSLLDSALDFGRGFVGGAVETVTGLVHMVTHPVETIEGLAYVATHPVETFHAVKDAVVAAWNENPEEFLGRVVFEVVTLPVGAAKLAKIKTVVDASKVANAIKTTDHAADLAHAANAAGDAAHAADQAADAAHAADQASDAARAAGMCFAAGTPVVTAEGMRAIEALRAGDLVLSRHEHTGETDWRRIVRTFERPVEGLVRLALRDGSGRLEALDTTDEHPFWVSGRGWVGAGALEAGQQLGTAAERALVVESVTSVAVSTSVYNFEVDGFHTYFVGETAAWVHNQCMTPAPTVLRDVIATNRSAIVNHGQDLTYYPRTPRPGQVRVTPPSEMEATRLPGAAIDQADNYLQDVWVLENKYETIISPNRIVVPPPAAGRLNTVSVRVHHLDLDAWQRGQMVERYRNPTVVGGSNPALTSVTQMPNGPAVFTHVQPPGLDKIPLQVKSSPGGGFFGDISIVTRPPP